MRHKHFIYSALFALVALSGAVLWYQKSANSESLPPPPHVNIEYSEIDLTNQDVRASLSSGAEIEVVNNGGRNEYVFTENGRFTFAYRDAYGRVHHERASVDNIDKEPPVAILEGLPEAKSYQGSAKIVVVGEQVLYYKFQLNDGDWTEAAGIDQAIELSDLKTGVQAIRVIGRDAAGNWQSDAEATTYNWAVIELTPEERFARRERTVPLSDSHKAIEVSIEDQHMWVYEGNDLFFHTPITTGASTKGWTTTKGRFHITQMYEDKWFDGGYFSDYWMRFNGGMGIHDANWRVDFGSQNYKWTGSHGCVNTPVDLMPKLYEWSEIGTAVWII